MTLATRRAALTSLTGVLIAAATAVTIGQAAAQAGGPRARSGPVRGHAAAVTAGQQAGVRRYWTPSRMEHARPLRPGRAHGTGQTYGTSRTHGTSRVTGAGLPRRAWLSAPLTVPPSTPLIGSADAAPVAPWRAQLAAAANGALWSRGGAVARTTGKVFFTLGSHDYVCSASTVASADSDVVVTAAHCVKDGTGAWTTNWTFVPGYANGKDPYGSYTARQFYVASQWSSRGDNNYDVAFVALNPAVLGGSTVTVGQEVGGQGIEFGAQPAREVAFGYPADPPYSGGQIAYCSGKVSPDPYGGTTDTGLNCPMTAGSSGGPWLSSFNRAAGTGIISSVSSFKYSTDNAILYGPGLGPTAQALYRAAARG
jgi:V8-like Glu-specific endopeptidase